MIQFVLCTADVCSGIASDCSANYASVPTDNQWARCKNTFDV